MRHFRLAVAQIAPTLGDLEKNLTLHEKMARQAIEQSANLLVFPELSLTGYFLKDQVPSVALRADSPLLQRFRDEAERLVRRCRRGQAVQVIDRRIAKTRCRIPGREIDVVREGAGRRRERPRHDRSGQRHAGDRARPGSRCEREAARNQRDQAEQVRRKRFERALEEKNIELEHASRMKSEFLATMSHELRTPLNAIIGFSEALRNGLMGQMSETQHDYIGDIFTSGQHLLSLINDILDLSKVEAGMMTLDLEAVQLSSLFANSVSIINRAWVRCGSVSNWV